MFVLVDDYSRYTWTLFLPSKDKVFEEFQVLISLLEKSLDTSLMAIRSDHGSEFQNASFLEYCRKKGITHNFSAPRTPQQNGVVERKNRTLESMSRTMMISNKVPRHFWAEAVNTACYILNRAMIRPQLNKTSSELLRGRKPNISHLRVFGSKCFVLNNGKNVLGKFDPRSDEGVFVGYVPNSKAYKVFNKRTKVVEESIHVVFDEKPRRTLIREPEEDADPNEFLNLVRDESDDEGE